MMTRDEYLAYLVNGCARSETITLHLDKGNGLFVGLDSGRAGIKDSEALDLVVDEITRRVKSVDPEFDIVLNSVS